MNFVPCTTPRPSSRGPVAVLASLPVLLLLTANAQSPKRPPAADTLAELRQRISDHLAQPRFAAATWGIKVVSLEADQIVFEHNAGKLLKPASNAKLFTAALALDRLGPDFRIKTSFYSAAKPDRRGTINGDLIVYGRGDPSFAARFNDGDYAKSLQPLVEALKAAGVKRIKGGLEGDESFFRGPPFGSSWAWDDLQSYYGAEVSALTQEDNVVDLVFTPGKRVGDQCEIATRPETGGSILAFINATTTVEPGGRRDIRIRRPPGSHQVLVSGQLPLDATNHLDSVPVHDPGFWFVSRLKSELQRAGVRISGPVRSTSWIDRTAGLGDQRGRVEIASVDSRPLSEIVAKMMKPSQNLYAQLLLLQVGAAAEAGAKKTNRAGQPPEEDGWTTESRGIEELKRFCDGIGIAPGQVLLDEGSGLSRRALVTPNAILELLQFMRHHRHAEVFRTSLPVAGVDGTLRHRMEGTVAEGKVTAKTGALAYVATLSGYLTTAGAETFAFSIMLNNYDAGARIAREEIDTIAVMLAEFRGRSRGPGVTY